MKSLRLAIPLLLLLSAPLVADVAKQEYPFVTTDPSCVAGEYKVWTNTADGKIKMCQNGVISNIGTSGYTGTGSGPAGAQYDPDRQGGGTLVTACSDEFDNGTSTGTWTWQHQTGATFTVPSGVDYAVLSTPGSGVTTGQHARTCTLNNAADWTMTVKMSVYGNTGTSGTFIGLMFPVGACNALNQFGVGVNRTNNGAGFDFVGQLQATNTFTGNMAGTGTAEATTAFPFMALQQTFCFQARYVVSTKVMTFRVSEDCRGWGVIPGSTHTFASDPVCGGVSVGVGNATTFTAARIYWIRTRTDAAGTSGEYLVGQ
jgi:hypothetical protein